MLFQLVLLVALQVALAVDDRPYYDVDDFEVMGHHFEQFMKDYHRQYSGDVKAKKFNIFIENVNEINKLNSRHTRATFDINQFADMSKEEKKSLLGFSAGLKDDDYGDCKVLNATNDKSSPAAWNWRDKNAVSPVKDQKTCGSCWAFSTIGLVESRSLQKGQSLSLSEQQLVDCDTLSSGCGGGLMTWGLTEIMKDGGVESEKDYPYTAKGGKCSFHKGKAAAKVASCSAYSLQNEAALQDLLYKEGPLAIAVQADTWIAYKSGILEDCAYEALDHGVLLVGYGTENGDDFWLIKNSWSDTWGEKGYIRIKKGVGCNGIGGKVIYATVSTVLA